MVDFVTQLGVWNWLIIAVILLILEVLAPGVYLIWFGLAAALVGGLALAVSVGWQIQLILFAVLSVLALILGRRYFYGRESETDQPLLNKRGQQYIGRIYTLEEPLRNGRGRMRVGDGWWRIEGPNLSTGRRVKVVDASGATLVVVAAEEKE